MKVKFANKVFDVLYTKKVAGQTMYAVEDEPNHIDWLVNVEVVDAEKKELKKVEHKFKEKYKTCDWLWNYGSIGLTKEHIKRLNNAINILESLHEYTDEKYLKEIKDKLLEDTPNIEKINNDVLKELKKIEQKPAWSEEDEIGLKDALWAIERARTIAKDENDMGTCWSAEHWLKSIKERMKGE